MSEDFREDAGEYYPGGTVVPGVPVVPGGGSSVIVDDALTKDGENPVKSKGVWSAIWGAVAAPAVSVYAWVTGELNKKQNALNEEQTAAVNSGITAQKVKKLDGVEAGAQKNPDLNDYAKTADLPYSLVEATVNNGSVMLQNRATTKVEVDDSVSSITFVFPEKVAGKGRDFFIRLVITGETVPTLGFVEPNGDAVSFDVDDYSWAEIERGVNILMFTDTEE